MQNRYSQRVPLDCSVMFAGDACVGEGRIVDISLPGCLLESSKQVTAGEYLRLRLFLPDQQAPLHVALAAVRWVEGSKLGIEFIRTSEDEQRRLEQIVRMNPAYVVPRPGAKAYVYFGRQSNECLQSNS